MIVYGDILLLLNLTVDYFLLSLTARLLRLSTLFWRQLFGAGIGAVSSFYIFLPQSNWATELSVRTAVAVLMELCCFGFFGWKRFFRIGAVLLAVTFAYAGGMIGIWLLFHPKGMLINNSVVYFNISPLFLIGFSVIAYFITVFFRNLLCKKTPCSPTCTVRVSAEHQTVETAAIVDSGNSVTDMFGACSVIIVDRGIVEKLFGEKLGSKELERRYRLLPCSSISGNDLLEGYRCDRAEILCGNTVTVLEQPILAISKARIQGEYDAIVNPQSMDEVTVCS
ncbi:MAG: sigma-E processing peptidase SpoIIGA [Clostridia bacterium]|nr:sigma-E processing peptidase SpoIIGA [Clostridia bacterium]